MKEYRLGIPRDNFWSNRGIYQGNFYIGYIYKARRNKWFSIKTEIYERDGYPLECFNFIDKKIMRLLV